MRSSSTASRSRIFRACCTNRPDVLKIRKRSRFGRARNNSAGNAIRCSVQVPHCPLSRLTVDPAIWLRSLLLLPGGRLQYEVLFPGPVPMTCLDRLACRVRQGGQLQSGFRDALAFLQQRLGPGPSPRLSALRRTAVALHLKRGLWVGRVLCCT